MVSDVNPSGKVLVLVPSYNHAKFLPRRINTILAQTYRDFHLLIIDDGSTDETAEYLKTLGGDNVKVLIREKNSGSPFSAWRDAADYGDFEYIWIAESDDAAEPNFLERGLAALEADPDVAFYFCHSWVINELDELVGHTLTYLRQQFPIQEWSRSFRLTGGEFNDKMQVHGNVVPNMSSMLMRMSIYKVAVDYTLDRFRLAADWFFVGRLAGRGAVVFDQHVGNHFRRHERTARAETRFERLCFEYFWSILEVGRQPGVSPANLEISMKRCATMFLHERGSPAEFINQAFRTDIAGAIKVLLWIGRRAIFRPDLLSKTLKRK